ncbi:hypothetical protein [Chlorogloeopsis sp. ULAP02]|uniref:hypothetical protein n=1 Tax=Chlorogloeopsis sp. ULAP02 TaxID=3107926 RepID=UPI00398B5625
MCLTVDARGVFVGYLVGTSSWLGVALQGRVGWLKGSANAAPGYFDRWIQRITSGSDRPINILPCSPID